MFCRGMVLTFVGVSILAASQFGSAQNHAGAKKLIEWGWDEPDTKFMRQHVCRLSSQGPPARPAVDEGRQRVLPGHHGAPGIRGHGSLRLDLQRAASLVDRREAAAGVCRSLDQSPADKAHSLIGGGGPENSSRLARHFVDNKPKIRIME